MNFQSDLYLLVLILIAKSLYTHADSSSTVYPTLRVLESVNNNISDHNGDFKVLNVSVNSDLIVGETTVVGNKLFLECRAEYPIQWIYEGYGIPKFSTNTTMTYDPMEFIATVSLGLQQSISEQETGQYYCSAIRKPLVSIYLYLFVPGRTLFTTKGGENITYDETDEFVRIPCSLSQPKASVTLQKSIDGQLHCPMNESISFDPKHGYKINLRQMPNPAGMYICTAGYNRQFQIIEYTLLASSGHSDGQSKSTTTTTEQPQMVGNEDESEFSSACSPNPCTVKNSVCREIKGNAVCRCLHGYHGNPYIECSNANNTSTNSTGTEFSKQKKCKMNVDCSSDTSCMEGTCVDPCSLICSNNSICKVTNHVPSCICNEGFIGDPYANDCHNETLVTTTEASTTVKEMSPNFPSASTTTEKPGPCEKDNPCGENTLCAYDGVRILCTCMVGFIGSPPYCRPECERDHHCPSNKACSVNKKCESPCNIGVCGRHAECRTYNHYPVCQCPPQTSGDPYIECQPRSSGPSSIIKSPCDASVSPCRANTECRVINNQAACRCLQSYRGNPYRGCRVDGCGYHAHCADHLACDIDNGTCVDPCVVGYPCKQKSCNVQNHIPVCREYEPSAPSSIKETDSVCKQPSPCGPNTICKNINGTANCSCMPNYPSGNPYIGCRRKYCTSNKSCRNGDVCIENGCQKPQNLPQEDEHGQDNIEKENVSTDPQIPCHRHPDCPGQLACSVRSKTCFDPCKSENPCGLRANCTTINHRAACLCPERHEGNPVVECTPQREEEKPQQPETIVENACTNISCDANEKCTVMNGEAVCECVENFKKKSGSGCISTDPDDNEQSPVSTPHYVPCHPLPCAQHAFCNEKTDPKSCSCLLEFYGDPYSGCQRGIQCETNSNCTGDTACVNRRCLDPCDVAGVCGNNQICTAKDHQTVCKCKAGYSKYTTGHCHKQQVEETIKTKQTKILDDSNDMNEDDSNNLSANTSATVNPGAIITDSTLEPETTTITDDINENAF